MLKSAVACILLLLGTNAALSVRAAGATPAAIHSAAGLERYLDATPLAGSPLGLLPAGARTRFLRSLAWGHTGIGGFDTGDLVQYLTTPEIQRVLALFDADAYADGLQGRPRALTAAERAAPETRLERNFDRFLAAQSNAPASPSTGSAAALDDRLLAPRQTREALARLNDSDVGLLYRAASTMALSAAPRRYLDDLVLDLATLHERGLATRALIAQVHRQFIAARDFAGANAIAGAYPGAGIARLPPLQSRAGIDGQPTALRIAPDGRALWREPIDLGAPLRIVVVAGCHYSVDAVRAIRADPVLGKIFHEHAVWLAAESESLTEVLAWNREFEGQPMHIASRNDEWTALADWAIPTFHVFRNGRLIDRWSGWPADGRGLAALRAHLRRDGVID